MISTNIISTREFEILHFISLEYTTDEIGRELFISYETVKTHRKNLLIKLKVRNVAGLIRKSFELGLLKIQRA